MSWKWLFCSDKKSDVFIYDDIGVAWVLQLLLSILHKEFVKVYNPYTSKIIYKIDIDPFVIRYVYIKPEAIFYYIAGFSNKM